MQIYQTIQVEMVNVWLRSYTDVDTEDVLTLLFTFYSLLGSAAYILSPSKQLPLPSWLGGV